MWVIRIECQIQIVIVRLHTKSRIILFKLDKSKRQSHGIGSNYGNTHKQCRCSARFFYMKLFYMKLARSRGQGVKALDYQLIGPRFKSWSNRSRLRINRRPECTRTTYEVLILTDDVRHVQLPAEEGI